MESYMSYFDIEDAETWPEGFDLADKATWPRADAEEGAFTPDDPATWYVMVTPEEPAMPVGPEFPKHAQDVAAENKTLRERLAALEGGE